MTVADVNVLRPRYLNRVNQMDFHWSVWNVVTGEVVMLFVTDKGSKRGYFTGQYDETKQNVWYWDDYMRCSYALGLMSQEPWTIHGDAVKAGLPSGTYKCSITRVNGQKLNSYEFTI